MSDPRDTALLTPNQVVAHNITRARQLRGWTQEQAAERLEPFLGTRWSKATFSAVERSVASDRVRQFTADDLVAFARAFELPVTFFLIPPPLDAVGNVPMIRVPDGGADEGLTAFMLVELVFGTEGIEPHLSQLLTGERALPIAHETQTQLLLGKAARLMAGAVIKSRTTDLAQWRQNLLDFAALLDDIENEVDERVIAGIEQLKAEKRTEER